MSGPRRIINPPEVDPSAQAPCSAEEYDRLVKSESLYRHLVENSLGLICSHDLNGVLRSINIAAADTLGYTPQELIGRNLQELVLPAQRHLFEPYLERILRYGRARGYLDLLTQHGSTVTWLYRNTLFEEDGVDPVVIGHAQDITWRLHMERSLRESSERFRILFERAPVAYHEINGEGLIIRVNRAECDLLGRSKDELIGTPVWELVSPEQRPQSREQVLRKLSGDQPLAPFFREYVRKDGSRVTVHIHEKAILSTAGAIAGIRSTLLDVTEQRRVESELRRLNAELDRRVEERTAELNASNERLKEFIYTVSHDLQEPLRSISSFTELLRTRYSTKLDADGLEFLGYVTSGASRMSALIKDLLAYSRILHEEDYPFEDVDLNDVLETVKENLAGAIDAGQVVIRCTGLPVVRANPVRMRQVFQNLLSNAMKYRGTSALCIQISSARIEGAWLVTVADNGRGLDPDDCDRVFGLFKRGRGAEGTGSGVGLAICRAVIERHGGRIWAEPGSGGGAVFRFTVASM
jgi:PAS domain S-box-containing protein